MPILGQFAVENALRAPTARLPGCRALLLYPMNALVNDQLSRIRKLFGDTRASEIISQGRGRPVRFGSYTGRTPYPGPRTSARDRERIEPLFELFDLRVLRHNDLRRQLEAIGQWPAKDLAGFYAHHEEEIRVTASGQRRLRHWDRRLHTQPGDRELMICHEAQETCPDVLITNYSMLEYMLMRPIERPIFAQTRTWLHSDPANELIVVLDEAHMYRGAAGAEVALLLRRLFARLDIPRAFHSYQRKFRSRRGRYSDRYRIWSGFDRPFCELIASRDRHHGLSRSAVGRCAGVGEPSGSFGGF